MITWLFKTAKDLDKLMEVWLSKTDIQDYQKSQNHTMAEVDRNLLSLSCPTAIVKNGHREQAASHHVQG